MRKTLITVDHLYAAYRQPRPPSWPGRHRADTGLWWRRLFTRRIPPVRP